MTMWPDFPFQKTFVMTVSVFMFLLPTSGVVRADALSASAITSTVRMASQEKIQSFEAIISRVRNRLRSLAEEINKLDILAFENRRIRGMAIPSLFPWLESVLVLYVSSDMTAREVKKELNLVNLQTVLGYGTVDGSRTIPSAQDGGTTDTGTFSQGVLTGVADMYHAHVRMFCFPEMQNAPAECGTAREAAGLRSNDTVVDIFLSPRTWERRTVIDGVRLAQNYFGIMVDTTHIGDMDVSSADFMSKIRDISRNNLRLAILNDLASRRATTSVATEGIVNKMLEILGIGGVISVPDYTIACQRPATEITAEEAYACGLTNKPDTPGGDRIISQAAMDRLLEYDLMISPNLYNEIHSSSFPTEGAMDRLQVSLKARQLAQDYRQLRLLQMKVAAMAVIEN